MNTRSKFAKQDNMSIKDVLAKLDDVKTELKQDVNTLKEDVKTDINKVKSDVSGIPEMNERMGRMECRLDNLEELKTDVEHLKRGHDDLNNKVSSLQLEMNNVTTIKQEYANAVKKLNIDRLLQEKLSKRWNVIIHGLLENLNSDGTLQWESRTGRVH